MDRHLAIVDRHQGDHAASASDSWSGGYEARCEGYPRIRTGAQMSGSTSVVRSWPCIAAHATPVSSLTRGWEKASLLQPGTQEARALRGSLISVSVGPLPYAVCQPDAPMSCQLLWCNSSLYRLHSLRGASGRGAPLTRGGSADATAPHSPAAGGRARPGGPLLGRLGLDDKTSLALSALFWSSFLSGLLLWWWLR